MKARIVLSVIFMHIVVLQSFASESPKQTSLAGELEAAKLEKQYLDSRNRYIRQFAGNPITPATDERPALADLEMKIKDVVGPINIEGFPKEGRINLATLLPELGFGHLDGLRFEADRETLIVTTKTMLETYLAEHPKLPRSVSELSKSEEFYRFAFHSGAAVIYYAEIPVEKVRGPSFAHAFIGVTAQDIGPFVPRELFVFVSKGNQILVVSSRTATEVSEIPLCRSEWDKYYKRHSEAYDAYRRSGLNDKRSFDDSVHYEKQAFEAYHRCYDREARSQQFFSKLKTHAQSIVDRLSKE